MSQLVLDYSSPGRTGKLRVGSRSVIRVRDEPERVEIYETLENRGFAMVMILLDLALIALIFLGDERAWRKWFARPRGDDSMVIALLFVAVALVLIVFVIKHNWTSALLIAKDGKLSVRMSDLIHRRRYELARENMNHVQILQTEGKATITELFILGQNLEFRLFTGHPLAELLTIQRALNRVLELEEPPLIVAEVVPMAQVVE